MTEEADHVGWSLGALKMVDASLTISEVMALPREHVGWHLKSRMDEDADPSGQFRCNPKCSRGRAITSDMGRLASTIFTTEAPSNHPT